MSFKLSFNNIPVYNGQYVSLDLAEEPLNIKLNVDNNKLYTLVMYDMSAPNSRSPTNSPFIHFLEINIAGFKIDQGDVLLSYMKPTPSYGTGNHVYVMDLFEQKQRITTELSDDRKSFPLLQFVLTYNLVHIDRLLFNINSPGDYIIFPNQIKRLTTKEDWVSNESGLSEQDDKYCRCVIEVAGKQSEACNYNKSWGSQIQGETCYNPYAVCHNSIKGESGLPECTENYVFKNIPDNELRGYASLNRISIPEPYNREKLIESIYLKSKIGFTNL